MCGKNHFMKKPRFIYRIYVYFVFLKFTYSNFRCVDEKLLQFLRHIEPIIKDIYLQISSTNLDKANKLIGLLATRARVVHYSEGFCGPSFSQFYNKYGEHLEDVHWFTFHARRAHHVHPNLLNEVIDYVNK